MLMEGLLHLPVGGMFQSRYRVVRRIKIGGMGAVYEVVDTRLERCRALKVMLPEMVADSRMCARFELETKATAKVHSEHVVETIDAGVDPDTGAPFLVMELLDGEDLDAVLLRRGALPPAEVVTLLRQIALALERVHAVDLVHRDLKPANVFLTRRDDGSPHIKVLDFGIAKMIVHTAQRAPTTRAMGTPAYMSPEQIRGDGSIGPRADLYALGHIAFTLLTGKPYWSQEESDEGMWSLAVKVMHGLPEPATARARALGVTLPAAFDPWFAEATALAPEARFATAAELVSSLAAALAVTLPLEPTAEPASARTAGASTAPVTMAPALKPPAALPPLDLAKTVVDRPRSRRRWPVLVAGAVVLGGLVTVGITWVAPKAASSASPGSAASPASHPRAPEPALSLGTGWPATPVVTPADAFPIEPAAREPVTMGGAPPNPPPPPTRVGSTARATAPKVLATRAPAPDSGPRAPSPPPVPAYDPADRP